MCKEKIGLISEVEKSFWELTDLIYYASQVGKISEDYFKTTVHQSNTENENEFFLYEDAHEKLSEAEDALYELIEEKQKGFNFVMRKVILSSDRTAFEYLFGSDFEIKNIDIFMSVFNVYISMTDYIHEEKILNKKEQVKKVIRELANEAMIEIELS